MPITSISSQEDAAFVFNPAKDDALILKELEEAKDRVSYLEPYTEQIDWLKSHSNLLTSAIKLLGRTFNTYTDSHGDGERVDLLVQKVVRVVDDSDFYAQTFHFVAELRLRKSYAEMVSRGLFTSPGFQRVKLEKLLDFALYTDSTVTLDYVLNHCTEEEFEAFVDKSGWNDGDLSNPPWEYSFIQRAIDRRALNALQWFHEKLPTYCKAKLFPGCLDWALMRECPAIFEWIEKEYPAEFREECFKVVQEEDCTWCVIHTLASEGDLVTLKRLKATYPNEWNELINSANDYNNFLHAALFHRTESGLQVIKWYYNEAKESCLRLMQLRGPKGEVFIERAKTEVLEWVHAYQPTLVKEQLEFRGNEGENFLTNSCYYETGRLRFVLRVYPDLAKQMLEEGDTFDALVESVKHLEAVKEHMEDFFVECAQEYIAKEMPIHRLTTVLKRGINLLETFATLSTKHAAKKHLLTLELATVLLKEVIPFAFHHKEPCKKVFTFFLACNPNIGQLLGIVSGPFHLALNLDFPLLIEFWMKAASISPFGPSGVFLREIIEKDAENVLEWLLTKENLPWQEEFEAEVAGKSSLVLMAELGKTSLLKILCRRQPAYFEQNALQIIHWMRPYMQSLDRSSCIVSGLYDGLFSLIEAIAENESLRFQLRLNVLLMRLEISQTDWIKEREVSEFIQGPYALPERLALIDQAVKQVTGRDLIGFTASCKSWIQFLFNLNPLFFINKIKDQNPVSCLTMLIAQKQDVLLQMIIKRAEIRELVRPFIDDLMTYGTMILKATPDRLYEVFDTVAEVYREAFTSTTREFILSELTYGQFGKKLEAINAIPPNYIFLKFELQVYCCCSPDWTVENGEKMLLELLASPVLDERCITELLANQKINLHLFTTRAGKLEELLAQKFPGGIPQDKKPLFLPFLAPREIKETTQSLPEEQKQQLLSMPVHGGLAVKAALSACYDEKISRINWNERHEEGAAAFEISEVGKLFDQIPYTALAVAAIDVQMQQILIAAMEAMSPVQQAVVIPQLLSEQFKTFVEKQPLEKQPAYLKKGTLEQKLNYLEKFDVLFTFSGWEDYQGGLANFEKQIEGVELLREQLKRRQGHSNPVLTSRIPAIELRIQLRMRQIKNEYYVSYNELNGVVYSRFLQPLRQKLEPLKLFYHLSSGVETSDQLAQTVELRVGQNISLIQNKIKAISEYMKSFKLFGEKWKLIKEVPPEFVCAIKFELMSDPVRAADKQIYDRSSIEEWFERLEKEGKKIVSPSFNTPMSKELEPLTDLKKEIDKWCEE